ncbi:hypothetical protein Hypma_016396 [Hypsizygus marmoreus]|uniref:Uncharacterized protein n=1 Tax=Hypsizygus marmoreus TaxID=39966 RepID=A0A369J7C3_HYPMA|nr:hypothetical protein Hypma_016396 [Hypsizygus marmoreus]
MSSPLNWKAPITGIPWRNRLAIQILKQPRITDSALPQPAPSFKLLWTGLNSSSFAGAPLGSSIDPTAVGLVYVKRLLDNIFANSNGMYVIDKYLLGIGAAREYGCWAQAMDLHSTVRNMVLQTSSQFLRETASAEVMIALYQLASVFQDHELEVAIVDAWLLRSQRSQFSPIPAIIITDDHGRRDFLALFLYEYLKLITLHPITAGHNTGHFDIDSVLGAGRKLRVLQGYKNLTASLARLCLEPPEFVSAEGCASHSNCLATWKRLWEMRIFEIPHGLAPIDIIGRLTSVEQILRKDKVIDMYMRITPACKESAFAALRKKREGISDNLHHHFDS